MLSNGCTSTSSNALSSLQYKELNGVFQKPAGPSRSAKCPRCASDHRGRRIVLTEPESPITFGRHFVLIAGLKYHTPRVRKAVYSGSMLAGGIKLPLLNKFCRLLVEIFGDPIPNKIVFRVFSHQAISPNMESIVAAR